MIYTFDSRVRFSETDEFGNLTIPALINYLQDCSTFQSEDLGVGLSVMKEQHQAWMIASWQIVIDRLPRCTEKITIGTMAIESDAIMARRNFFIRDEAGEMIVKANTYWTIVDTQAGRAIRIEGPFIDAYGTETPIEMECAPRKIRVPAEGGIPMEPYTVTEDRIDANHHVNNGQYVQIALSLLSKGLQENLTADRVRQIRAEYKKAAVLGDVIHPVIFRNEDTFLAALKDEKGFPYCTVELKID